MKPCVSTVPGSHLTKFENHGILVMALMADADGRRPDGEPYLGQDGYSSKAWEHMIPFERRQRILRREHFGGDLEGLRAVISRTLGEVLVMEREAEAEEGSASGDDAQRGGLEEQGGRGEAGPTGGGTP